MKTAPWAFSFKYLVHKPAFFLVSGRWQTCRKLLGLLTTINVSFEVPIKVAFILVHKGAAKLQALKHFLHSKKVFYIVNLPILMQQRLWRLVVLQLLGSQIWLKFFSDMRSVSRSVLTSNLLPFFSVSPITTQYVFVSSISVVGGHSLQISQASQICKICAFASNQLKTIAKIEGHQME